MQGTSCPPKLQYIDRLAPHSDDQENRRDMDIVGHLEDHVDQYLSDLDEQESARRDMDLDLNHIEEDHVHRYLD